jgi:ABC-2 type transport system permease protein
MLWYKAWLETRWRFVIGLVLLVCSGVVLVQSYPATARRLAAASTEIEAASTGVGGVIGEQIRQGLEATRSYDGYIWWQWFRQSLRETWTIFAALLGTGGLLAQSSGGGALYTLSMPVSRTRLLGVRAATGLVELFILAMSAALVVPVFSPAIGQSFSAVDALVYGMCLFVAGSMFFSLAFLLSTVFTDIWRPALIAIVVAYVLVFGEQASPGLSGVGILHVMSAQSYFAGDGLPWAGLLASAGFSAAMLYGATVNIARRDF